MKKILTILLLFLTILANGQRQTAPVTNFMPVQSPVFGQDTATNRSWLYAGSKPRQKWTELATYLQTKATIDSLRLSAADTATVGQHIRNDSTAHNINLKESILTFGSGLTRTINAVANDLITGKTGGQTITFGTAVGDYGIYKSTTGAGTSTGVAHQWKGGTNGGTVIATMLNNGKFGIGLINPTAMLEIAGRVYQSGLGNSTYFGGAAGAADDLSNRYNAGFGAYALTANTSGSWNTAFGFRALYANTIANYNNAIGAYALTANVGGGNNNAMGIYSLAANISSGKNNAMGSFCLQNSTGEDNTGVGYHGGFTITTGNKNTFLGSDAGYLNQVADVSNSTAIGYGAYTTASNQVAIGNNNVTQTLLKGNVSIGITPPTARLHLPAGTATAGTAPTKWTPVGAVLNTLPEIGAFEPVTDDISYTIATGTARKQLVMTDGSNLTDGYLFEAHTNGRAINSPLFNNGGNIGNGTTTALHRHTVIGSIAGNLNLFNYTISDINKNRTTIAQATDTASFHASSSSTGNITLHLVDKAGVTSLYVDSAGVSIGTTASIAPLEVHGLNTAQGYYEQIRAMTTDAYGVDIGGGISFGGKYGTSATATFGAISGRKESATINLYDGYLAFGTNAQATGVTEKMRITSGGNVGIGYSTGTEIDNYKLAVNGKGYFNDSIKAKAFVKNASPDSVLCNDGSSVAKSAFAAQLSPIPHAYTANTNVSFDRSVYVNGTVSTNDSISVTLSNIPNGQSGGLYVTTTAASVITFIVDGAYTLQIGEYIYNTTTNAYTKTVYNVVSGYASYAFKRVDNTVIIHGTQIHY